MTMTFTQQVITIAMVVLGTVDPFSSVPAFPSGQTNAEVITVSGKSTSSASLGLMISIA